MANTSFYQYLKEAFRFRVKHAENKDITLNTHFTYPGLRWNLSYKQIFEYSRKLLPSIYRDIAEFPNTEEGNLKLAQTVLEKLDRHLDIQLENQFNTGNVSENETQILAQAQTISAQATEQQALETGAPATGFGGFGLPTPSMSPSYTPRSIVIHNIPHAETEKPEIHVATTSGKTIEAGDPSKLVHAGVSGNVIESGQSSKLVTTSSGQVVEPGQPSKLVSVGSSGQITGGLEAEKLSAKPELVSTGGLAKEPHKPPSSIHITEGNALREYRINTPGRFRIITSKGLSGASRFIGNNLEKSLPFLGQTGHKLADSLMGLANPRGLGGGSRSIFGKLGGFGKGGKGGGSKSLLGKGGKGRRRILLILLGFLGPAALLGFMAFNGANQSPTVPTGITGSDISSCKFTRAGTSESLQSSTLASWISSAAVTAGIPPATLASVAVHESPSFVPKADNNHDAIKNNYYYFVNPDGNTRAVGVSQISTGTTVVPDPNNPGQYITVDHCQALLANGGAFQKAAAALGKKIMDKDYYCVDNVNARIQKFCQTDTVVLNSAIYAPPDNKFDDSYLNLCRITDNLAVGAALLTNKIGGGSWTNENDVKGAVRGYYGGCDYPGGNYCTEVWNDYQSCQATTTPTSGSGITDITSKAAQVDSLLYQTNPNSSNLEDRLYHNKKDEPGVYYWCTYIVVDAYNAAGFSGLSRSNHGAVLNMKSFFASTPGYQLLPANTPIEQLHPGDVIFFEGNDQHTSLVKSIEVSKAGNGIIKTYEANNVVLEDVVYVNDHQAISAQTTAGKLSITGFGQVKTQ